MQGKKPGAHPRQHFLGQEVIRVAAGTLSVCIPGDHTMSLAKIPEGKEAFYTCLHEVVLRETDQIVLQPGIKHWFQAADKGAVFFSIMTRARDLLDCFSDPMVARQTVIADQ